jgi:hypothetical protein
VVEKPDRRVIRDSSSNKHIDVVGSLPLRTRPVNFY